jgi:DNA-binding NtrC family response regulator
MSEAPGASNSNSTRRARILIVDDDPIVGESLADYLGSEGYDVASCVNAEEAIATLADAESAGAGKKSRPFNVVLCDVAMPGKSGLELLREVSDRYPHIVMLMLTAYGSIESAVEAIRHGASDYLAKPVVDSELRLALEKALRQQALLAENHVLRQRLDEKFGMDNIVGSDYRMVKAYELIEAVAPSKATVLMTGESGTGKSLIARAIHERSPRRARPFIEIHCGSVPETLLESELFGHVKGAFTGAVADKQGRFLAADTGSIFIDEINSASPAMQLKLLRVLQERKFEPVGSTQTVEVDVRVILATNQPLEDLVSRGQFRQDLYYRINVVKIELPPLRERTSDIPLLVSAFVERFSAEYGKTIAGVTQEAIDALRRYPLPGNVRELQNIIERAVVLARTPTLGLDDLPAQVIDPTQRQLSPGGIDEDDEQWTPMPLTQALEDPERRILLRALKANQWNRQATADQLQINRTTLYKKMKSLGIDRIAG